MSWVIDSWSPLYWDEQVTRQIEIEGRYFDKLPSDATIYAATSNNNPRILAYPLEIVSKTDTKIIATRAPSIAKTYFGCIRSESEGYLFVNDSKPLPVE